jgi:prepilin-type N-terminal cleavage/methylation domain-containing protein
VITNSLRHNLAALIASRQRSTAQTQEQGLTLIECLVAIIMVALIGSAIAPALVISVATRVQSQRAEQALQLAQSEIDRVRLLVERGEATAADLPPAVANLNDESAIANVNGPLAANPVETPTDPFETRLASLGGNQFAVQVYRSPGLTINDVPLAFTMGVRVYDEQALASGDGGNLPTVPASLGLTGGSGQRIERPLAALYTTVAVSEASGSLCNYIQYVDSQAALPQGCD